MIIFETERLILREMTLDDLPVVQGIVCDEQTMYAWNGAWSKEESLSGLEKQISGYREDGFGRFQTHYGPPNKKCPPWDTSRLRGEVREVLLNLL